MFDAFDRTELKNTSLMLSRHTSAKKEFDESLRVDTHRNRTEWSRVLEIVRVILNEKYMPESYWAKVANVVVYLMNQSARSNQASREVLWKEAALSK